MFFCHLKKGGNNLCITLDVIAIVDVNHRNARLLVNVLGIGKSTRVLTLFGLGQVLAFPTTCPEDLMFLVENTHLLGLNFKFTSLKHCNTV
jgi:hypothetical protein